MQRKPLLIALGAAVLACGFIPIPDRGSGSGQSIYGRLYSRVKGGGTDSSGGLVQKEGGMGSAGGIQNEGGGGGTHGGGAIAGGGHSTGGVIDRGAGSIGRSAGGQGTRPVDIAANGGQTSGGGATPEGDGGTSGGN